MYIICQRAFIFKRVLLCGYWELRGRPHHSFDVFCHGESIFDSAASVWALYLSIPSLWCCKGRTKITKVSCNSMKINKIQWKPLKFNGNLCKSTIFPKILGQPCNIRAMESIDRVPKHLRHYQKWIPHEKIRRSYGAVVLLTRNRRRARHFWN